MLRHLAETLLFAAAGGAFFGLLGFPAGWLSGAMMVVAGAALAGRPMLIPNPMMRAIFVLIGISLGAVVTPETLRGMAAWPVSIVVLIVSLVATHAVAALYLVYVHNFSFITATLAGAPGALSQVMVLSVEYGADPRAVAIVQTMRVAIVSVGLPAGLVMLGLATAPARTVGGPFSLELLPELLFVIASCIVVAIVFHRIRFPGGLLFGSMLCSAVLHGGGFVHAVMPWWAANAAMIALGAMTGARFANTPMRLLLIYLGAAFGSFAIALVIAALFVALLAGVMSFHVADAVIAFAPGAVDAMMILALALNLDPVYVGAHHLARIFFVSLLLPFVARLTTARVTDLPVQTVPLQPEELSFED
jgi:membrane AbrB-like protein